MTLPVFQSTPIDGSPELLELGRLAGANDTVNAGVAAAFASNPTSCTASAAATAPKTARDVRATRARRRCMADLLGSELKRHYPVNGPARTSSRAFVRNLPQCPLFLGVAGSVSGSSPNGHAPAPPSSPRRPPRIAPYAGDCGHPP